MPTSAAARPLRHVGERYLRPTPLLDYHAASIEALIDERGWAALPESERIGAIYDFVRDEIAFGYNRTDDLPASAVLADGFGQCDTKAILLMALLRATGIPCRLHGAVVEKRLQRGVAPAVAYRLWRADIRHSWVEVRHEGSWLGLDGVVLDGAYLDGVRAKLGESARGAFVGYAVGTYDIADPPVEWRGTHTAIQTAAFARELGTYDDPDGFYRACGSNFTGLRGWIFRHVLRQRMNRKVAAIRALARA
jgi:transglutaminase-like putative cysteine protease